MKYLLFIFLIVPISLFGQIGQSEEVEFDSIAAFYANKIDTNRIKSHLKILASDSLQGRKTGTTGQKMAADYISTYFAKLGLNNRVGVTSQKGYYQKFKLESYNYLDVILVIGGDTLSPLVDYYSTDILNDTALTGKEIVFLGYGIDADEYSNYPSEALAGKIGVMLVGEPMKNGEYLLSGTTYPSKWSWSFEAKYRAAQEHGLAGIIIVNDEFDKALERVKPYLQKMRLRRMESDQENLPRFVVGPEVWPLLFPKSTFSRVKTELEEGEFNFRFRDKNKVNIYYADVETVPTANIYGFIRGTKFPKEAVFITAHYDHLGKSESGEVYNGADDNGSGTSAILELARVFKLAAQNGGTPKRTIVFMLMTGEEEGLLGSSYYAEHPFFPMDSTVADLNIDMIGRTDTYHLDDTVKYIYPIGSDMISHDLNQILEESNALYTHFELDYRYDDPNDPQRLYYRSDHYNFARNGVPVIFFFRGLHADYHKPTDTIDKIEFNTIKEVAKLVFYTAWELANRPEFLERDNN